MTFKSRLINITKNRASIADIIQIDLSSIPEGVTFDDYLKSPEYKALRTKLYGELLDTAIRTKFISNSKSTKEIVYKLIDDSVK